MCGVGSLWCLVSGFYRAANRRSTRYLPEGAKWKCTKAGSYDACASLKKDKKTYGETAYCGDWWTK